MAQTLCGERYWPRPCSSSIPLVLGFFGDRASGLRFGRAFPRPSGGSACRRRAGAAGLAATGSTGCWRSRSAWLHCRRRCRRLPLPGQVNAAAGAHTGERAVYRLLQLNLRLRQPDARKGAVADRARAARRDHARTRCRRAGSRGCNRYRRCIPIPSSATRRGGSAAWRSCRGGRLPFGGAGRCSDDGALAIAPIDFGGQRLEVAALHLGWPWPFKQRSSSTALRDPLGSAWPRRRCSPATSTPPPGAPAVRRIEAAAGLAPRRRASGRPGSTAGCPTRCGPMPACRSTRSSPRATS